MSLQFWPLCVRMGKVLRVMQLMSSRTELGVAFQTNLPQIVVVFHLISALKREAPAGEVQ